MKKSEKKPFFPKDKPKSWVMGISSGLVALLIAGPVTILGVYLELSIVKTIGTTIFILCWVIFAVTWFVFAIGMLSGKYRNLQEKEWGEQIW